MLDLLRKRKSVRSFGSSPISDSMQARLNSEATYVNSHESGLNFRVIYGDDAPFRGFARSYGMLRNVNNYLAVVLDPTFPDTYERAGYFAEQWILEAVKLGLGTCFVGGTFSSKHVETRLEVYETVPFVVAFGHPETEKTPLVARIALAAVHRKVRTPRDFYDGDDAEYEIALQKLPWLGEALEAVALAPSTLNKQPVRLKMCESDGALTVEAHTVEPEKYAVELGIAKCNVSTALGGVWDWGEKGVYYPD